MWGQEARLGPQCSQHKVSCCTGLLCPGCRVLPGRHWGPGTALALRSQEVGKVLALRGLRPSELCWVPQPPWPRPLLVWRELLCPGGAVPTPLHFGLLCTGALSVGLASRPFLLTPEDSAWSGEVAQETDLRGAVGSPREDTLEPEPQLLAAIISEPPAPTGCSGNITGTSMGAAGAGPPRAPQPLLVPAFGDGW